MNGAGVVAPCGSRPAAGKGKRVRAKKIVLREDGEMHALSTGRIHRGSILAAALALTACASSGDAENAGDEAGADARSGSEAGADATRSADTGADSTAHGFDAGPACRRC
jgi:hypothetical protein